MAISNFAIPAWILENLSPEEQAALRALAAEKQFEAANDQLAALAQAATGVFQSQTERDQPSCVTFLKAAAVAIREALFVLDPATVPAQTIAASTTTRAVSTTTQSTTPAAKQKSNATWYYVRNNLDRYGADRYVDPGDMRAKNPEGYRALQAEAAQLFDAGRLSPSGKLLA